MLASFILWTSQLDGVYDWSWQVPTCPTPVETFEEVQSIKYCLLLFMNFASFYPFKIMKDQTYKIEIFHWLRVLNLLLFKPLGFTVVNVRSMQKIFESNPFFHSLSSQKFTLFQAMESLSQSVLRYSPEAPSGLNQIEPKTLRAE